ncbi:MAG: hypothetical protein ACRERD_23130 [Candidatus Binatia bacterium]
MERSQLDWIANFIIVGGPEHSPLSNDAFPSREFDFILSNPLTLEKETAGLLGQILVETERPL